MSISEMLNLRNDRVISLVGGGGKTTTMYRLASEFAEQGVRTVITTTTRIRVPDCTQVDGLVIGTDRSEVLAGVKNGFKNRRVLGIGSELQPSGKLGGIPPEWVEALLEWADCVIVEADGAKGRPFKAPADHEPVLPSCAQRLIAVVGIDAVGRPLDAENVHRPECVQAITGLGQGETVRPTDVAAVALHPQGLGKGMPLSRQILLINKVETNPQLAAAKEICGLAVRGGFGMAAIACLHNRRAVIEVVS
ncbi:MAG: putative selenium-dependent hydroxylase accessory protein YqeC [Clostridiales Family XIII bacterium]|jgi:molybdenum cofactor cytidylyltransferase|nr:putative selenium-dependent hydroxylase accessory protein YqeC [Clostridiales Family XIII bacterium]